MPTRDRAVVGLLVLFLVSAFTVELYFVVYSHRLPGAAIWRRKHRSGQGDRAYYDRVTAFERGLKSSTSSSPSRCICCCWPESCGAPSGAILSATRRFVLRLLFDYALPTRTMSPDIRHAD